MPACLPAAALGVFTGRRRLCSTLLAVAGQKRTRRKDGRLSWCRDFVPLAMFWLLRGVFIWAAPRVTCLPVTSDFGCFGRASRRITVAGTRACVARGGDIGRDWGVGGEDVGGESFICRVSWIFPRLAHSILHAWPGLLTNHTGSTEAPLG